MLDDHVVEYGKNNDEIGLQSLILIFYKYKKGVVREGLIEYPYLLMLMKLCYGY